MGDSVGASELKAAFLLGVSVGECVGGVGDPVEGKNEEAVVEGEDEGAEEGKIVGDWVGDHVPPGRKAVHAASQHSAADQLTVNAPQDPSCGKVKSVRFVSAQ